MPHVKIENLSKSFGSLEALRDVNLEVEDEEYVSIIGPSGCGKTTLIKCIAGIMTPSKGEVYVDGKRITDLPMERRNIGYVFQEIALFPHLNVRSNISYGPRVKNLKEQSAKLLVNELIELVEIGDRSRSKPSELSGGAQQKVAVARALGSGSTLLLLDEPFGALDAKVRSELRYEIRKMVKDLRLTALHVTHDQEEAMSVADKIVVMKSGRIVELGKPEELYIKPREIFTANFVGEANFMQAQVTDRTVNGSLVEIDGISIETNNTAFRASDRVIVAVRPEFILMELEAHDDASLRGKVDDVVFIGNTVRYRVRISRNLSLTVKHPLCNGDLGLNHGDDVFLHIPPERALLYSLPEAGLSREIQLE
ncbi:MAG: ABC transporter ATP-binding protein [archaeon]